VRAESAALVESLKKYVEDSWTLRDQNIRPFTAFGSSMLWRRSAFEKVTVTVALASVSHAQSAAPATTRNGAGEYRSP